VYQVHFLNFDNGTFLGKVIELADKREFCNLEIELVAQPKSGELPEHFGLEIASDIPELQVIEVHAVEEVKNLEGKEAQLGGLAHGWRNIQGEHLVVAGAALLFDGKVPSRGHSCGFHLNVVAPVVVGEKGIVAVNYRHQVGRLHAAVALGLAILPANNQALGTGELKIKPPEQHPPTHSNYYFAQQHLRI
jgi:hypothetical protein